MKELYIEGLANHNDHESCADTCKGVGEALTVAHTGWAIEPRNRRKPERRRLRAERKAPLEASKLRDADRLCGVGDPSWVGNLCMCGNSLRGNRESPWFTTANKDEVRAGNPNGASQR
jgi:RNA-directed DNA polymerase